MIVSSRRTRAAVGGVVVICGWVAAACGSSSPPSPPRSPSAPSARHVQDALLKGAPPRPTSASCHPATTAERDAAPFGHTTDPVFVCVVGINGRRQRFDVQVLTNGCYVAERTRPGQAIYGCGVTRS